MRTPDQFGAEVYSNRMKKKTKFTWDSHYTHILFYKKPVYKKQYLETPKTKKQVLESLQC